MLKIFRNYNVNLLENKENYCLLEVNIKVKNLDYIEKELRDVLLDMLVNGGTFVRVMVYY